MRIALISDIHANEVALKAVLADIAKVGADQIVCLGDVATMGPLPSPVIQALLDLGCVCIQGNHDAFITDPAIIHTYTEMLAIVDEVNWCRSQLSQKELDFLHTFRNSIKISLDTHSSLQLFHGSPRSHMENILSTTPPDELDRMLEGHNATVMAFGHTHVQMLRQHRGMLIVNPGSVGMPFKEFLAGQPPTLLDHAEYAMIESDYGTVDINLRRVPIDKRALLKTLKACNSPFRDLLLQQYT